MTALDVSLGPSMAKVQWLYNLQSYGYAHIHVCLRAILCSLIAMYDIYLCTSIYHLFTLISTQFYTCIGCMHTCCITFRYSPFFYSIAIFLRFFNCFNLRFSAAEKLSLFSTFDRDGSGSVSYDEFIRGVRGEMNDFRLEWVNKAPLGTTKCKNTGQVAQRPLDDEGKNMSYR